MSPMGRSGLNQNGKSTSESTENVKVGHFFDSYSVSQILLICQINYLATGTFTAQY